jgi:hypothetical protein
MPWVIVPLPLTTPPFSSLDDAIPAATG